MSAVVKTHIRSAKTENGDLDLYENTLFPRAALKEHTPPSRRALLCFMLAFVLTSSATAYCKTEHAASKNASGQTKRYSKRQKHYGLVPPPPPTAVSPVVLAAYPQLGGRTSLSFIASKPRQLADEMKLTAVVDDVAFFKVSGNESIHLKKGKCYQTVTVAQIDPDQVVLEEKGKQFVKHLQ